MTTTKRGFVRMAMVPVAAAIALATGPSAMADAGPCLPLNGSQLHASSVDDPHVLGITVSTNVDYWYANGAVNWHKTIDGGAFNATHLDTTGAVPAGPGSVVTIPGATPDGAFTSANSGVVVAPIPITATVCSR